MGANIIIHVSVGNEKHTELFSENYIRIGSAKTDDIQIHSKELGKSETWFELENSGETYRIVNINPAIKLIFNDKHPVYSYMTIGDGDTISLSGTDISFSFFSPTSKSSLITTRRETHVAQFIEEAAIESAASPKRDDAKIFLKELFRELSREISWTTKLIILVLALGFLSGIFYIGYEVNKELKQNREQAEKQSQIIQKLEEKLGEAAEQIGQLDKTNKEIIKTVSLAPNLRVEYGNGVCLIVGVYDLVSRLNGKTLRYPDPQSFQPDPNESFPMEDQIPVDKPSRGLTTEGNGTPIEYDFIGTGFHVGSGYILTNRHVLQPWEEDELINQIMRDSDGKPRIKRLVAYFPNNPQPFPLKIKRLGGREDLAVAAIDASLVTDQMPALPLDTGSDAMTIGRTVVSMGYPSGPDRLLAMFDDSEARNINARCSGSRQCIINFLAQNQRIVPLLTQGSITDLDSRRIVHDAKTAEGGSGAPLFGQTGKVIGVNFGVFTENTAANMAVPINFAISLLKSAGWKSPEEVQAELQNQSNTALNAANTNSKVAEKK